MDEPRFIETRIDPTWLYKWVAVSVAMIAFGGWSWYDAAIGYPDHNLKASTFHRLKTEGRLSDWPAVAAEHGWTDDEPEPPHHQFDITVNWISASAFTAFGLLALAMVATNARRTIRCDADGLITPRGERITFDRLIDMDMSRWESKGIAVVSYTSDAGVPQKLKLDAWVYQGDKAIIERIRDTTGLGDTHE